jgi:hypothetical protein
MTDRPAFTARTRRTSGGGTRRHRRIGPMLLALVPLLLATGCIPLQFAGTNANNNDGFYNWDFQEPTSISADNVDNPVDLVFGNSASINYVKGLYARNGEFCGLCGGSAKYEYVIDNTPQPVFGDFDQDSGRKGPFCSFGFGCPNSYDIHYRLYADSRDDQQGFDPGWGFYVVGTIHYDVNEGSSNQSFGYNEQAEGWVIDIAQSLFPDAINSVGRGDRRSGWNNHAGIDLTNEYGPAWLDSTHYLDSNGWATWVSLH